MNNIAGTDVSKGKSMIAIMRPPGEVVATPFEVGHTAAELNELAKFILKISGEARVVMEYTLQTVLTDYQGKSSAIKRRKSCLSKNLTSFMPHKRWEVAGSDVGFLRSGFALSSQSNIILLQIVTFR